MSVDWRFTERTLCYRVIVIVCLQGEGDWSPWVNCLYCIPIISMILILIKIKSFNLQFLLPDRNKTLSVSKKALNNPLRCFGLYWSLARAESRRIGSLYSSSYVFLRHDLLIFIVMLMFIYLRYYFKVS